MTKDARTGSRSLSSWAWPIGEVFRFVSPTAVRVIALPGLGTVRPSSTAAICNVRGTLEMPRGIAAPEMFVSHVASTRRRRCVSNPGLKIAGERLCKEHDADML